MRKKVVVEYRSLKDRPRIKRASRDTKTKQARDDEIERVFPKERFVSTIYQWSK